MPIRTIACCTDFSRNAEAAFLVALEMAEKYGSKLFIVHVQPPLVNPLLTNTEWVVSYEPETDVIPQLQERLREEYGNRIPRQLDCELVVLSGHISSEILRFLEEQGIDLAVLGAFGFSGMGLVLFGSVSKRVAHRAACSIMIVRLPKAPDNEPATTAC